MVAHVLKRKRLELYMDFEREVPLAAVESLRSMVKRRADGEPLHYILGVTSFYGMEFAVDRRVLIPRPETELLVDEVVKNGSTAKAILDIGTGSGSIAVALAKHLPQTRVVAVDASAEALEVATANASSNAANVDFLHGDLFSPVPPDIRFDWIVSNPPYIPTADVETLPREIRDHEPRAALDGGPDGLRIVSSIASEAANRLASGGKLALELGAGQCAAAGRIFLDNGWYVEKIIPDLQGHERVLVAGR